MSNNPLIDWYNSDSTVKQIIDRVDSTGKSFDEQAEIAFHEFCEVFKLAKFPDDISEELYTEFYEKGLDEPRSVYEEIGILRFLAPGDDPRSIVFRAIYDIKNYEYIDIDECAIIHFGKKKSIPKEYMVYYSGENSKAILNFLKEGESWTKDGVKYASKVIRN